MKDLPKDNPVEKLRNNEINVKKLRGKIKYLLSQEKTLLNPPNTKNLFTDHIYIHPNQFSKKSKDRSIYIKGKKYHPIIAKICNMTNAGISPQIYITGNQRLGKSKTAHYIAEILHNEINLLQGTYNPHDQLLYNNLEYLLATATFKRKVMLMDEAENYLNTQDRWDDFVKNASGLIRSQSIRQNPQFIITPTYKHIAPQIRKHVDILINMVGKRKATVKVIEARHDKIDSKGYDFKFNYYPKWIIPKLPKQKIKEYNKIENKYKGRYSLELLIQGIDTTITEKGSKEISTL